MATNNHGRSDEMASKRIPRCHCGAVGIRDERYDAYYCPESGEWLESACKDPECPLCSGRPGHFAS